MARAPILNLLRRGGEDKADRYSPEGSSRVGFESEKSVKGRAGATEQDQSQRPKPEA